MLQLTWADLLVENITPDQFRDWLNPWRGVVTGSVAPAFMSKFGFWFLRRPSGQVDILNVFSGELSRIAETYQEFVRDVNEKWWQETYLFSELVHQLHSAGKVPGSGQCYGLCPHPAHGGRNPFNGDAIEPRFVTVMGIVVWQSICAQALQIGR